jgi:outer membrane protein TolC
MDYRLVILLALLLFLPFGALEARNISFSELSDLIAKRNELVEVGNLQAQSREAMMGHFKRSLVPEFNVELGYEAYRIQPEAQRKSLSRSYWQIGMEWNLYRGGRDFYRDNELKARASQSHIEKERLLSLFQYKAEVLYWTIVGLSNEVEKTSALLSRVKSHRQEVDNRVQNKVLRRADVLKVDIYISRLEGALEKISLEKDEASNRLALLLGFDDHKSLSITDKFPSSWPKVTVSIPENSQTLNMQFLQSQNKIIHYQKSQGERSYLPTIDLFAVYGRPSPSDEYDIALQDSQESAVGLRFQWSLGQWQQDRTLNNSLNFERASNTIQKTYEIRENRANLHETEHDISTLSRLITRTKSEMKLINEAHSLVLSDFAAGLRSNEEVLNSFESKLEAELSLSEYQSRYLSHLSKINWLTR